MAASIVLIGPSGAGKSTVSVLLAARLGWQAIELDKLRWEYFAEIGYDADYAAALREREGFASVARYWKPFDIHGVERVTADYLSDCVIAFGAGHSFYEDPAQFARAQKALTPFPVVLLLPNADIESSATILRERIAAKETFLTEASLNGISAINRTFLVASSNALLAKHTVYTAGHSPEQTCDAILALLSNG
jgi:hypothetical protein